MHKVAVIILSYNCLNETTKPCLESIFEAKNITKYQIVVVDNKSNDGTVDYLKAISTKHDNLCVIFNDMNYGFAAGNNIGLKSVDSEIYILLNSDTIVTDYWADKIYAFMKKHPEVGMVGPVSNSVGNEQAIHVDSVDENEIISEGLAWAERCAGDMFYTTMLGFFCVGIRKKVIDEIGLLDENFGIGMFEDDDYCRRALGNNCKLACMEDVFIYHKGSVSFNGTQNNLKLNQLFLENLNKFESKHNARWRSGCTAPPFINLIEKYLVDSNQATYEKIKYKINNKVQVLKNFYYPYNQDEKSAIEYYIEIENLKKELDNIKSSITWKLASYFHHFIDSFNRKNRLRRS